MIESVQNQHIKALKKLQQKSERDKTNLFLVTNRKIIIDLLDRSPELVTELLISTDYQYPHPKFEDITTVSPPVIKQLSTEKTAQGIVAVCKKPTYELSTQLKQAKSILICDQVSNPDNLGAIIRNALAFNVDLLCLTPHSTDPFHPNSIRSSAGAILQLPICNFNKNDLHLLPNYPIYTLATGSTHQLSDINYNQYKILIFGSESRGICSDFLKSLNSTAIRIPINKSIESLNLAVATGIALYTLNQKEH